MSFQVGLAVISLLEGQLRTAERLLRESLAYYLQSGDELSVCALRFYLTLVALRSDQAAVALTEIEQSLGWMAGRRIDFFPHWWHPALVSEVCAYALVVDLYPEVAERMFVYQLGEAGVEALRRLLKSEQTEAHLHAQRVLALVESQRSDTLKTFADSPSRRILATLLQNGQLRRDGFAALQQALMTAHARQQPNATALAVFALYVTGCPRAEIALRVGCTVANVRNYITFFYRQFGIDEQPFCSRKERWQRLVQCAQEAGFLA
jgi:DNA-binding NarL/FixJ family response regulator